MRDNDDIHGEMISESRKRIEDQILLAATWPICPVCDQHAEPGRDCETCVNNKTIAEYEKAEKERHDAWQRKLRAQQLGGLKAFEQFKLEKYTNKTAIELCAGYPDNNLFIWGTAGTGKTHLATALLRKHREVLVVKPQQIYRDCRGIKSGEDEQAAINYYINMPLLVIDDLGVDKKTDFSFSTLYEIIEGRDMACKKGLIVTSNLSLTALSERMGDDRITSRIAGMCKIIELTGKDYRLEAKK